MTLLRTIWRFLTHPGQCPHGIHRDKCDACWWDRLGEGM